jgi:PASTA domain/Glucodextranase, domain B
VRRLILLLAAGLVLSACGETPRPTTDPRVRVKLDTSNGTTRDDHVAIRGTVTPADAAVQVMGKAARVSAGQFTADIGLRPGANVIDVTATSPGRRPATDALRYLRDMRVDVPNVLGKSPEDGEAAVTAAGLKPEVQEDGNWLDRLLGSPQVCASSPAAGTPVAKGTTVTLQTSRNCG